MPIDTSFVSPELFLSHQGVNVFCTYKNDDIAQGVNTYYFTLCDMHDEGGYFDVRTLDVPSKSKLNNHPPYLSADVNPDFESATEAERQVWRDQWAIWHEFKENEAIRDIIVEAIELGVIQAYEED